MTAGWRCLWSATRSVLFVGFDADEKAEIENWKWRFCVLFTGKTTRFDAMYNKKIIRNSREKAFPSHCVLSTKWSDSELQRAVLVCHWDALQACFQVTNFVGFSRSSIRFFCRGNCSGTSLASCLQFNISQSVLDCVWLWSLNRFFPPVIFQRVVAVGARGAPWKGCSFCFRKVTTEVLS